jgi:hypothetical protein
LNRKCIATKAASESFTRQKVEHNRLKRIMMEIGSVAMSLTFPTPPTDVNLSANELTDSGPTAAGPVSILVAVILNVAREGISWSKDRRRQLHRPAARQSLRYTSGGMGGQDYSQKYSRCVRTDRATIGKRASLVISSLEVPKHDGKPALCFRWKAGERWLV